MFEIMRKFQGIIGAGLISFAFWGCGDDTEIIRSNSPPKEVDVVISQEYIPPRSTIEPRLSINMDGDVTISSTSVHYPEEYFTHIKSAECQQTFGNRLVYDYFQKNQNAKLPYVEIFEDIYKEANETGEKILESTRKMGCKFIIP